VRVLRTANAHWATIKQRDDCATMAYSFYCFHARRIFNILRAHDTRARKLRGSNRMQQLQKQLQFPASQTLGAAT
jgi:hypothetical protein